MIRLGIIGAGNMGTAHIENILAGKCPEITITAVADRRESRRIWAKEKLPSAAIFNLGEELVSSSNIDAVLIATPHYEHPSLACCAFNHGLHVMVEKPAGVFTKQVRELIEEADRHPQLAFGMMFNQRTNCVYRKMKEIISSGELGTIKRVSWLITDWYRTQYYYDSGNWRATWAGEGGGVLLNQCPHQLDLLQWLCGLPILVRAYCHEGKWHNIEVEDDVTAYMEFDNGATGVFVTTTADAPGTNRLEVSGTRGKLVCEDASKLTFYRLTNDETEWRFSCKQAFMKPECEIIQIETDGQNLQHSGVLNAFAGKILRGEPLVADGREGIRGLMLSNAMHLSSWLGKEINLPVDEELFHNMLSERCKLSKHKVESDIIDDMRGSF